MFTAGTMLPTPHPHAFLQHLLSVSRRLLRLPTARFPQQVFSFSARLFKSALIGNSSHETSYPCHRSNAQWHELCDRVA